MRSFRSVQLPADVPGHLYLHSMPGRHEPLDECWAELGRVACSVIVCLTPDEEIRTKSPMYADALNAGSCPCFIRRFPITDFQAPDDIEAFRQAASDTAEALRRGDAVIVHCGAGIGRTGTFAMGTVMALGISYDDAQKRVSAAGSSPERPEQHESLRRLASALARPKHDHAR